MARRSLAREVSRLGVLVSGIIVVAGLLGAGARGMLLWHMALMLYGGLLMFPHYVAIAYVSSSAGARGKRLALATAIASVPLLFLPAAARLDLYRGPAALLLVAGLPAAAAGLVGALERRGSLRLSLAMVFLSYAGLAGVVVEWWASGFRGSIVEYGLSLALAYTVTLIIAVTVHSLPSTFGDKPFAPAAIAAGLLSVAAGLVLPRMSVELAENLWLAGALLYVYGARLVRVGRYFRAARERSRGNRRAYMGLWYYLVGHVFVLILIALAGMVFALTGGRPLLARAWKELLFLHMVALGFAWMHVAIHAPMMLPVILGVRHAMRYNVLPYVLCLASALLWPVAGDASLVLELASLAAMVYVFLRV